VGGRWTWAPADSDTWLTLRTTRRPRIRQMVAIKTIIVCGRDNNRMAGRRRTVVSGSAAASTEDPSLCRSAQTASRSIASMAGRALGPARRRAWPNPSLGDEP
jgi:hypothetical protein